MGKRVLVVDDVRIIRETISLYLGGFSMQVDAAENGSVAFKRLLKSNPPMDLVIVDLDMPVMDGVELVSLIRSIPRLQKLPVLILTARMHLRDVRRATQAGADGYILKKSWREHLVEKMVPLFEALA